MVADLVNGTFEFVGSIMLWLNVRTLYQDKGYLGINWGVTAFFASWGYWNMYYYPSLGQWLSFAGGCSITLANTVWLSMMFYYGRKV